MRDRQINALITIDIVINEFLSEKGLDVREYDKLFNIAVRGYTHLAMFHIPSIKMAVLTFNEAGLVTFPDDCVTLLKYGINFNGRFWSATHDNDLIMPFKENCGQPSSEDSMGITDNYVDDYMYPDSLAFTKEGFNSSYVKVDYNDRTIAGTGNFINNEIYVIYKSTGVYVDRETFIPITCKEPLIAFIDWRLNTENQAKKAEWISQQQILRDSQFYFNIDDFRDVIYQTSYFGEKG